MFGQLLVNLDTTTKERPDTVRLTCADIVNRTPDVNARPDLFQQVKCLIQNIEQAG